MEKYHISDGKTETGPYSLEQLKEIPINKNYLVWKQGMTKWVKISEIEELKNILYSVPPPILKRKIQIIKSYKIKHILITFIILFLIVAYLKDLAWGFYVGKTSLAESVRYADITVIMSILLTVIFSVIIYNKNLKKLK